MEYALLLRWLLLYAALAACGLPLCAIIFPRFPNRGAPFAIPVALAGVTLPLYWLGHLALAPWTYAVVGALLVVSAVVAARRVDVPWLAGAEAYIVFAVAVLVYARYRAAHPAISYAGGEKFLHFGVLNAVLRADSLPPEDMWYAGKALRYYYGGHLMSAALSTVTSTAPRYAYNLAMSGYFGVLVVASYGVGGALSAAAERSRRVGGLLAVFFVAVAGFVVTAVRLGFGLLPESTALAYGRPVFDAIRHFPYEESVRVQSSLDEWGWFFTRYVIDGTLLEFPLYSYVKADHHGHTITTGFLVVAAAFAYAYYRTPAEERRRRLALLFGVVPAFAGLLGVTNTWVLPSVVGLAWLGLVFAPAHPVTLFGRTPRSHRLTAELSRVATATGVALVVGVLSFAWGAPFLLFGTPTNDGVGFLPSRSPAIGLLLVWGSLLALFVPYLASRWERPIRSWVNTNSRRRVLGGGVVTIGVLLAVGLVSVFFGFPALALVGLPLVGGWVLLRMEDRVGFETMLLVAGLGLVLAMELVYAKVWPPGQERWNTTFKVGIQAWTLCGLAAAGIVSRWGGDAVDTLRGQIDRGRVTSVRNARAASVLALCLAVVLVSTPFAALAFAPEVAESGDTLDGFETYSWTHEEEMEAIAWLNDREGTPTIVEAPGRDTYSWQNPASTLTGIPTVVGWDHQQGYRGVEAFERRASDVKEIYTGRANRSEHLRRYDVEYVWVGPIERERYGDDLVPFTGPAFEPAYESENVTIYAVDSEELDGS